MTVYVPEPVRGQAVNQSAELRSALEFFATAHSFRERSFESVNLCCWNDVVVKVPVRSCRECHREA